MKNRPRIHGAAKALAFAAVVAVCALPPVHAQAQPDCDAPLKLVRLAKPLARLAGKLASHDPIVIVAIGSSSTAGAGASSKAKNYPSRLEAELKRRFPEQPIKVINRGIGGEVIGDMLKRFDKAVVAAKPDLVLWQLGTNSVMRRHEPVNEGAAIRAGLAKLRSTGADVVLINPQFAPKVINKPQAEPMLALISLIAKQENVDLFRRFAVMKRWHDKAHLEFTTFVAPDGLHMNDWSYACMAKGLAAAIADAATRPVMSAAAAKVARP